MVPLLLFLILLVIAWSVFAIFGGTLLWVFGSHLHIVVPTVLISIAYIAFLARIAKRNNIKLGGKIAEALAPSKPIGPEFQRMIQENGDAAFVKPSLFNAPDQWKRVAHDPDSKPRHDLRSPIAKRPSPKRAIALAALAFIVAGPLTVVVLDRGMQIARAYGLFQSPSGIDATSQTSATSNRWLVQPGQSAMLEAISGKNFLGQPVALTVWCDGGRPNLTLSYNDFLGSDQGIDGFKTVILQVDSRSVQEFRMALGPDQTKLVLDGRSPDLIPSFLGEGVLRVYTAPYNSEPVNARFDLKGAKAALSSILDACPPPAAYTQPEKATVSFHGEGGMIHVLKTGDEFPFTRTSPPGVELLYGDCRMAVGQYCDVGLTLNGNNLARIWSASVPVGSP